MTYTTINGTEYKVGLFGKIIATADYMLINDDKPRKHRGVQINTGWNVYHSDRDVPESQHGDDQIAALEAAQRHQAAADERKATRAAAQAKKEAAEAKKQAEEAELKALATEKGPLATPRQVDYIWSLVCQGRHEEGGFYSGPTTLDGIRRMTKASASIYINSLTDNY